MDFWEGTLLRGVAITILSTIITVDRREEVGGWPKWPKPSVCHIPIPSGTLRNSVAHCGHTGRATHPFCHRRTPPSATQLFLWNAQDGPRKKRRHHFKQPLSVNLLDPAFLYCFWFVHQQVARIEGVQSLYTTVLYYKDPAQWGWTL